MSKIILTLASTLFFYQLGWAVEGKLKQQAIKAAQTEAAVENDKALDILLLDPFLSAKYERGEYLLYDCEAKHWVCTVESEFKRCKLQREIDERLENPQVSCAPIKKYASNESCIQKQIRLTNADMQNRFCRHSELRKLDMKF